MAENKRNNNAKKYNVAVYFDESKEHLLKVVQFINEDKKNAYLQETKVFGYVCEEGYMNRSKYSRKLLWRPKGNTPEIRRLVRNYSGKYRRHEVFFDMIEKG